MLYCAFIVSLGWAAATTADGKTLVSISDASLPRVVTRGFHRSSQGPLANAVDVRNIPSLMQSAAGSSRRRLTPTAQAVEDCLRQEGTITSYEFVGIQVIDSGSTRCEVTTDEICSYLQGARANLNIHSFCDANVKLRFVGSEQNSERIHSRRLQNNTSPDPLEPEQSFLVDIKLEQALEALAESGISMRNETIAIVDTGVDVEHEDLRDAIYVFSDGSKGYDFDANVSDPTDDHGHGTHCAGIAAAQTGNGVGGRGVSNAKIMALKLMSDLERGVAALDFAIENGAAVSSLSWGTYYDVPTLAEGLRNAGAQGHMIIAAAGNKGYDVDDDILDFPCELGGEIPTMLCVSSVSGGTLIGNYGQNIEIAGFGESVLSTYPGDDYRILGGTSMATPQVAGAAAILLSMGLAPEDVKRILISSSSGETSTPDGEPSDIRMLDVFGAVTEGLNELAPRRRTSLRVKAHM